MRRSERWEERILRERGGPRVEGRWGAWSLGNRKEEAQRRPVHGSRKRGGWKALEMSTISPLASFLIAD